MEGQGFSPERFSSHEQSSTANDSPSAACSPGESSSGNGDRLTLLGATLARPVRLLEPRCVAESCAPELDGRAPPAAWCSPHERRIFFAESYRPHGVFARIPPSAPLGKPAMSLSQVRASSLRPGVLPSLFLALISSALSARAAAQTPLFTFAQISDSQPGSESEWRSFEDVLRTIAQ